jgi:hypothetical protein
LGGKQVVLLVGESFGRCQHDTKTIQLFRLAKIRRLNLNIKSDTDYLTLSKFQEKRVAKVGSNYSVYHRNIPVL